MAPDALEACPISNQLLRYTSNLRMHLILNSYLYSGMTEDEKQLKINVWSLKWDRFVSGAAQTTPDDV